jgi:hypothetical protein
MLPLRNSGKEAGMFEFLNTMYLSLDAPLWAVLGCPVGLVLALHFANDKNVVVQGARVDEVARQAREKYNGGRSWLKSIFFFVALGYSIVCFTYVMNPSMILGAIDRLPI